MQPQPQISFIGAGNMATSLIVGLIRQGVPASRLKAADTNQERLAQMQAEHGIGIAASNIEACAGSDILLLCVKPQVLRQVCEEIRDTVQQHRPLVISIAAGIESTSIEAWLGGNLALVRCMPNTPALVGIGASGLFANARVSEDQKRVAESIFSAVGMAEWVAQEDDLHAVTAVSGSGPAYFFLMLEAMEAAGVACGLPADSARRLAIQTMLGAATMAQQSPHDPATLKRQVMSPGGTTERAIQAFEDGNLRGLVQDAVEAAAKRSRELAQILGGGQQG